MKNKDFLPLAQFRRFLFDTIVPLEDILDYKGEQMSKIMPFWRKKELIPFVPNGNHKIEISFSDLLWLRILDGLRQFGYPIEKQTKVSEYFFKDAYKNDLPRKNLTYNQRELNKKKAAGIITDEELHTLEAIERHLKDERYLYVLKFEINYLTNLIVDCIKDGKDRGILIFMDGKVGEQNEGEQNQRGQNEYSYYNHSGLVIDPSEPHIYFSIQNLLKEFIEDKKFSDLYMSQVFNEDETEVVKQIEKNNIEEIIINELEGPGIKIKCSKGSAISHRDKHRIKIKLCDRLYQDIHLKTMDGNSHTYVKKKN